MIDWYVLLVPAAVLAVLLLLQFAGCSFQHGLEMVSQLYPDDVVQDGPLVYYRMQEQPGVTVAADEMAHVAGLYGVSPSPLNDPAFLSLPIASPTQQMGALSVMPKDPNDLSVYFNGSFVSTQGQGAIGDLSVFSLEALVHPEWDLINERDFYCVIDLSNFVSGLGAPGPGRNAGFAVYAGPDNPNDPGSPMCWQLWIGTGNEFARANPVDGSPGPLVLQEDTYVAVLFDTGAASLWAYTMNADLGSVKVPVIRRPYVQAQDPTPANLALRVGLSGDNSALIPPFPGPANFIYPFVGRIAEVAVYNKVLDEGRIMSHIMNAFNTA
jgi:hypothetical protein